MNKSVFTQDPANKKMLIDRTFDAPLDLVWQAWTDASVLDQWWAPKPWKTETKYQDFSEGGYWLYSMNGPEGEQHWARADYKGIDPKNAFRATDAFCDEEGVPNNEAPSMQWHVSFTGKGESTQVHIDISFPSVEDMDKIIEMGFKEGFNAAHENLDDLLAKMVA